MSPETPGPQEIQPREVEPPAARPPAREENPVVAWAKAILGGIQDTARDMLEEGREGAREKRRQMWARFDAKTKSRRRHSG